MKSKYLLPILALGAFSLPAADFVENFNSGKSGAVPENWNIWQPANDPGKAVYNSRIGRTKAGSAEFITANRTVLQRGTAIKPGKWYRFSAWAKTNVPGTGAAEITVTPEIKGPAGERRREFSPTLSSKQVRLTQDWQLIDLYLQTPGVENLKGNKADIAVLTIYGRNSADNIYYDDLRFAEVQPEFLYSENFTSPDSIKKFDIYARGGGIEGVAVLQYNPSGYADKGSISVVWKSGKAGYGAVLKNPIKAAKLGKAGAELTMSVRVSADKHDGVAGVGIEQLDANGKIISLSAVEAKRFTPGCFQNVELSFKLDPAAVSVRPVLSANSQITLHFDSLNIRKANAGESALLALQRPYDIWMDFYPADFYAWIDNKPAAIYLPCGSTNSFYIQLAGDKTIKGDTVVEVELDKRVKLLTAEAGNWSSAPSPWTLYQAKDERCQGYRFVNPIDWQSLMVTGHPNPWSGLELVVKTDAAAGDLAPMSVKLSLAGKAGESRVIPVKVMKPYEKVGRMDEFKVGIWDLGAIYVLDNAARKELVQGYVDSGVVMGTFNLRRSKFVNELPEQGYTPIVVVHGPVTKGVYSGFYSGKVPMAVLNDGRTTQQFVALGMAMNDPDLREAYRKYLRSKVASLPAKGPKIVSLDIEFWSDGVVSRSCFHPATIAMFRKYAKLDDAVKLDSAVILKKYAKEWSAFRNQLTADLHALVRDELRAIDPEIKLAAYDYTLAPGGKAQDFVEYAPMNTLLYDDAVDIHKISYYNVEGVRYLDAIDNDCKHLKKPVWAVPYISEGLFRAQSPNWNYHHPSAGELRREVLGAIASGAKGFIPFTGKLVDADRLSAINSGAAAASVYYDFYSKGKRCDEVVSIKNMPQNVRYRVHELNGKYLLTVFNCGRTPVKLNSSIGQIAVAADDFVQKVFEK